VTPEDLFEFYNEVFIPVYAEVVSRRREKPRQVAIEIENAFSHLSTYFSVSSLDEKTSNIKKAIGHIQRATLDCQKILWITLFNDAVYLEKQDGVIEHASNVPLNVIYEQLEIVKKVAIESRLIESQNTGIEILKRIETYQNAIDEFKKFDQMIDIVKARLYKEKQKKSTIKHFFLNQSVGFLLGVMASISASYIYAGMNSGLASTKIEKSINLNIPKK
jgi:hypothetical protein